MHFGRNPLPVLALLACSIGCVSTNRGGDLPQGIAEAPDLPVALFDRHGVETDYFHVLDACVLADAVFVGETHGQPIGLEFAAHLFEDILESRPTTALSMEFYNRDQQVALNDYLAGITDDEAFKTAAKRTKGNDPPGHRRMLEAAKRAGVPVVAANAPRRYVTLAGSDEGYDRLADLSRPQRMMFAIPERLPSGEYRKNYDDLMGSMMSAGMHGEPVPPEEIPARLEAGFRSQALWDATMSESIHRALDDANPVVHVIGRFHSDFEGGTVQLLREHRPRVKIVTLSFIDREPGPIDPEDLGRADFVIYTASPPEPEDSAEPERADETVEDDA